MLKIIKALMFRKKNPEDNYYSDDEDRMLWFKGAENWNRCRLDFHFTLIE